MISWVPNKNININEINQKIDECLKKKHLTNNGNNVINLQKELKTLFHIDEDKEILLTCNGAMGINTLIGGLNIYFEKKLRWAVQSFTFPCSKQGLLIDSIILDIDENMGINIHELENRINDYDGILITNCFGTTCNINLYENFCKNNNKLLLFDNAASPLTFYNNKNILNYGLGCMVSLHHTKPIGFGEGGFIVFNKNYLGSMEKTICFGFTKDNRYDYNLYASNYKMSEISCIYVSNFLKNLEHIYNTHIKLINYFLIKLTENNLNNKVSILKSFSNYNQSLLSTIPLVFNKEVETSLFIQNNIEAKKYYYPLDFTCNNSVNLFNRIICLPLNTDITFEVIDIYIKIIMEI
jgi:dTDP-4-amino-4,6-dideoxygalactose transaminase